MSKSNPLAAAKARINGLEKDNENLRKLSGAMQKAVTDAEYQLTLVSASGKQALSTSRQAIEDLQSVNAELRDACEELQQQRNKAQTDAKTYHAAFWVLFIVAALSAAVDALIWWRFF